MSNKTLVPDKLHGYLLQVIHMLYELISVDDRVVSVEKLDDVAVEIDGKVIAEQLRLSKLSDRLQRDLNQIKTVAEGWKQEVAGWLSQAHEYGLTNYIPNSTDEFARQVDELRVISQKRITDVSVSPEHVADLSKDIAALRQEEQQISSEFRMLILLCEKCWL